jgi:hypothetical protein
MVLRQLIMVLRHLIPLVFLSSLMETERLLLLLNGGGDLVIDDSGEVVPDTGGDVVAVVDAGQGGKVVVDA